VWVNRIASLAEHRNRDARMNLLLLSSFLSAVAITSCSAAMVSIFAAASLMDSLKQIAVPYEKESGDKLVFNFGASSLLARQVEEGAPADIFFSADEAKMDAIEKKGLLLNGTRKKLLGNALVIVVAHDSRLNISSAADLKSVKLLALAEPSTVPAGIYAKEFLTAQNLWRELEPKIIPTDNVRAALGAVEAGNVDAAIIYKTDAAISKKVKVAVEIPREQTPKISYPIAVLKESRNPAAARRFVEWLSSEQSKKAFESFGFVIQK
jgi:molybdate transport system substrate-binding protein